MLLRSITEHIDFATPLQEPAAEPLCNANLAASMHTLDHLAGVANRAAIHYTGESQLREVGWREGAVSRAHMLFFFSECKQPLKQFWLAGEMKRLNSVL